MQISLPNFALFFFTVKPPSVTQKEQKHVAFYHVYTQNYRFK